MYVLYGTVQSDHISVAAEIDLQLAPDLDQGAPNNIRNNTDWSAQGDDTIHKYGVNSEILLRNVELPTEVLLCKECNCTKVVPSSSARWRHFFVVDKNSVVLCPIFGTKA